MPALFWWCLAALPFAVVVLVWFYLWALRQGIVFPTAAWNPGSGNHSVSLPGALGCIGYWALMVGGMVVAGSYWFVIGSAFVIGWLWWSHRQIEMSL